MWFRKFNPIMAYDLYLRGPVIELEGLRFRVTLNIDVKRLLNFRNALKRKCV